MLKFQMWNFKVTIGEDNRVLRLEQIILRKDKEIKDLSTVVGRLIENYDLLSCAVENLDNNQKKTNPKTLLDYAEEEKSTINIPDPSALDILK
jgi:hypothetical protein